MSSDMKTADDLKKQFEEMMDKRAECLLINTWSSACGNCDEAADPNEIKHITVLGRNGVKKGCGVKWKYVSSDYPEHVITSKNLKMMRPDLILDRTII